MPKIVVEKHRYDVLSNMILSGWDPADIAKVMSLDIGVVKRFAAGKGPEGFNIVHEAYREKVVREAVCSTFKFIEMGPKAYRNIEESLEGQDKRLASDNAWKVIDRIAPPPKVDEPGGGSITMNFAQTNTVNNMAMEVVEGVTGMIKELKKVKKLGRSYEKHLKTGEEALPAPVRAVLDNDPEPEVVEVTLELVAEGEPSMGNGENNDNQ